MQREHVDRHVIERDRHEDLVLLPGCEVVLDRLLEHCGELLAALGPLAGVGGPGRPANWSHARSSALGGWWRHAWRATLPETSKIANLYAQVVKRLQPAEVVELGQDVDHRVVGTLLCDVVELRPRERAQLPAAAVQLVQRRSAQNVMESRDGPVREEGGRNAGAPPSAATSGPVSRLAPTLTHRS